MTKATCKRKNLVLGYEFHSVVDSITIVYGIMAKDSLAWHWISSCELSWYDNDYQGEKGGEVIVMSSGKFKEHPQLYFSSNKDLTPNLSQKVIKTYVFLIYANLMSLYNVTWKYVLRAEHLVLDSQYFHSSKLNIKEL